jgi:hypothetical protein
MRGGRTATIVVLVKCSFEHVDGRTQDGRLTQHKAELLPVPDLLQLRPQEPRGTGAGRRLAVHRAQWQLQPPMHWPAFAEMRRAIVAVLQAAAARRCRCA